MNQMPLFRVAMPTGSTPRPIPEPVSRKIARLLEPWLPRALAQGRPLPLPFPAAAGFTAQAQETGDGLLVRLLRPFEDRCEAAMPVASIGVAADPGAARALWRRLARESGKLGPAPGAAPCCLLAWHGDALTSFPEAAEWLDELAEGLARLWLSSRGQGPRGPGAAAAHAARRPRRADADARAGMRMRRAAMATGT